MADYPWLKSYPSGLNWNAPITKRPVPQILDDAVKQFADRPFLDFLGKKYTYREVAALVDKAAAGFQKMGVGKGVKVGLFLPNCPQQIICYFGVLKAGGTVVNYSPLYAEKELVHQIEDSHTDIMVTLDLAMLLPKMELMLKQTRLKKLIIGSLAEVLPFPKNLLFPIVKRKELTPYALDDRHSRFKDLIDNDGRYQPASCSVDEDIAVLQYTGGTTGVSKGAMLTHGNLSANVSQTRSFTKGFDLGNERVMGVLPFFHVFAMTAVMLMSIDIGAEIILHPKFELDAVLNDIDKKKPTFMAGVPAMYTAINNSPRSGGIDLKTLKRCSSGGAPLPVEVKARFEAKAGTQILEGYGLTESSPVATSNPLDGVNKPGSIGIPVPGTVIEICDRDDPLKIMPLGEPGEICIRGPQVMKGYWNRADATAAAIVDGKLRTGDVGYMDPDGYIFIVDRIKDMILVGGFNVFPRNVEEAIYQHPAVAEVTVIGVQDEYLGQVPKAFVKLKDGQGATETEVMTFLKDKLGKHELPRQIEFRKELPKTLVGKLSKKELVAEEAAKYEAAKKAKAG
ncbi:MAG: long-chain fatty acid--CoA ligase [Alphaproteobacteria bacterium]|nr:long-chain fatty acid--CoA ligase [Alphaproteobacteria bacterium]